MVFLIKALIFMACGMFVFILAFVLFMVLSHLEKQRRMRFYQKAVADGRRVVARMVEKKMPATAGKHVKYLALYRFWSSKDAQHSRWYSFSAEPPAELTLYVKKGRSGKAFRDEWVTGAANTGFLTIFLIFAAGAGIFQLYQLMCAQFFP